MHVERSYINFGQLNCNYINLFPVPIIQRGDSSHTLIFKMGILAFGTKFKGYKTKACMQMLTATLFIISPKLETTQISINWWTDKLIVIYPYYGSLLLRNKKEILMHATTWMDFENILNKGQMLHNVWLTLYDILEKTKWSWQRADGWLPGASGRGYW